MKKRSTTLPGTCSKETGPEQESEQTDEQTSSASCREALERALYIRTLKQSEGRLRQLFQQVRTALLRYELEAVHGLLEGTSVNSYEESTLNRARRCEMLLGEIDLLITGLSFQTRQSELPSIKEEERNLLTLLKQDFPFETH